MKKRTFLDIILIIFLVALVACYVLIYKRSWHICFTCHKMWQTNEKLGTKNIADQIANYSKESRAHLKQAIGRRLSNEENFEAILKTLSFLTDVKYKKSYFEEQAHRYSNRNHDDPHSREISDLIIENQLSLILFRDFHWKSTRVINGAYYECYSVKLEGNEVELRFGFEFREQDNSVVLGEIAIIGAGDVALKLNEAGGQEFNAEGGGNVWISVRRVLGNSGITRNIIEVRDLLFNIYGNAYDVKLERAGNPNPDTVRVYIYDNGEYYVENK